MRRVLLLLDQKENQQLLTEELGEREPRNTSAK
jgi:hypothetical protein